MITLLVGIVAFSVGVATCIGLSDGMTDCDHEWGKWEEIGDIIGYRTGRFVGIVQERCCGKCGMKELRKERAL